MNELSDAGFTLAVTGTKPGMRQIIEVYPHAALLRLLCADYRIPYKVGRIRRYWPDLTQSERKEQACRNFARILDALQRTIDGIRLEVPSATAGAG